MSSPLSGSEAEVGVRHLQTQSSDGLGLIDDATHARREDVLWTQ